MYIFTCTYRIITDEEKNNFDKNVDCIGDYNQEGVYCYCQDIDHCQDGDRTALKYSIYFIHNNNVTACRYCNDILS